MANLVRSQLANFGTLLPFQRLHLPIYEDSDCFPFAICRILSDPLTNMPTLLPFYAPNMPHLPPTNILTSNLLIILRDLDISIVCWERFESDRTGDRLFH
jgi:hypothetical protein